MLESGSVAVEVRGQIATVIFAHPKANALPSRLLHDLAASIEQLGEDPGVKVIVLRSDGEGSFCAGAFFDELREIQSLKLAMNFFGGFARVIIAMRDCPKFVIARVHGKAVGGGVGLIAAADYAYADQNAAVRLTEFENGFGPFVVGPAIERKVGVSAFSAMAIDCGWRDANWAARHGLIHQLVENREKLDDVVADAAKTLATRSPQATAALKSALWTNTEDWPSLLQTRAKTSARLWMERPRPS